MDVLGAAEILVNCTSVGLDGGDPFGPLPLEADALAGYGCVVDLVYTPSGTPARRRPRTRLPVIDGLQILVGQGALSFEQFTGREAPLEVMRRAAGAR